MSSTAPVALTDAWDNALERLRVIQQGLSGVANPLPSVQRVSRLDAELLDAELVVLLREPINKALHAVTALRSRFDDELALFIRLVLYKLSVWDAGASYGAKLQGLRYARHSNQSGRLIERGLNRRVMAVHSTLTILVPYMHSKMQAYALSHSWPDAPLSDRRRRAWETVQWFESLHSTFSLLNFVAFLANGRYRTLADRFLKLRLVSTQDITRRAVSYEFMNRQMVWHAFSEFLLFLLPIVNVRSVRRMLRNAASHGAPSVLTTMQSSLMSYLTGFAPSSSSKSGAKIGKWHNLHIDECAICADNAVLDASHLSVPASMSSYAFGTPATSASTMAVPNSTEVPPRHPINTAYMTSCNHLYCYICLSDAMLRARDDGGSPWECLRCASSVTWCERAEADVPSVVDSDASLDEYEFSDSLGDSVGSIQTLDYTNSSESHSQ